MPLDFKPRSPREKLHDPESDARRQHLLQDNGKWNQQARAALRIDVPDAVKRQRQKENMRAMIVKQKKSKWVPHTQLNVSMFGKASRIEPQTVKRDKEHERRLEDGTQVMEDATSGAAAVSIGRPITISTAPRFPKSDVAGDALNIPSAASYNPKPVRPHSASARLAGKGGPGVVMHKGVALYVTQSAASRNYSKEESSSSLDKRKKEYPEAPLPSSLHPDSAKSFTKASRFDNPADQVTVTPGPAAYDVKGDGSLGKRRQPHVANVRFSAAGREQRTVVSNNSLFYYATKNNFETPGVGQYTVRSSSLSPRSSSFPKAPRMPSPPRERPEGESPSKKRGVSPSRRRGGNGEREGVEEEEGISEEEKRRHALRYDSPTKGGLDRHCISAAVATSHRGQKWNKADSRKHFSMIKGQVVYNLNQEKETCPGVGAYAIKDGLSLAEKVTPRRPQSARVIGTARRFPNEGGAAGDAAPSPGPGQYDSASTKQFEKLSFNKYIRHAQENAISRNRVSGSLVSTGRGGSPSSGGAEPSRHQSPRSTSNRRRNSSPESGR